MMMEWRYFVEDEYDGADAEYDSIADKSLTGQPTHTPGPADLEYNKCEPKCLHRTSKGKDQGELPIAEEQVCGQNYAS